jgi:hypothetical protein
VAGAIGIGIYLLRPARQDAAAAPIAAQNLPARPPVPPAPQRRNVPPNEDAEPKRQPPKAEGNQPGPIPGFGAPGEKPSIVLSDGQFNQSFGPKMEFTMSYRFEKGAPRIGDNFFVKIKSQSGKQYEANITSFRLQEQGTIHLMGISFGSFRQREQGPFDIHIEIGTFGPIGKRETCSNTIHVGAGSR